MNNEIDFDDMEAWAEEQWDNWPNIETDLQFGFDFSLNEVTGEFYYCVAYFSYWKFKVDIQNTLEPKGGAYIQYPVELTISIDPDGDCQ